MKKPRIAIFDFAGCEGCQLQIVNLEEDILGLLSVVDAVEWREAMSEQSPEYEVAIIEGSMVRPADEDRLRKIRERAKILVAMGACASNGGVNKLVEHFDREEARTCVYGAAAGNENLQSTAVKSVAEVVKVDYSIPGCPIDKNEFAYVVKCLAMGREPNIPTFPVCVECKMKENECRFPKGEICLGPITRAGCDAKCPSEGSWCFGCRGPAHGANLDALREAVTHYGMSPADLDSRLTLFRPLREVAHV